MATVPQQTHLGYFVGFMQAYGRADYPTRAELYRDTQAYSYGAESAAALYQQVSQLLGVSVAPAQPFVSPAIGMGA
jgi:hypothetical protein